MQESNKIKITSTYSSLLACEESLSYEDTASFGQNNETISPSEQNDITIQWIASNYNFFSAALDGHLRVWAEARSKQVPSFKAKLALLETFKQELNALFSLEKTIDIRLNPADLQNSYRPSPWVCFVDSIVGITGPLRDKEMPDNSNFKMLKIFLEHNSHIAQFLATELPKLNEIVEMFNQDNKNLTDEKAPEINMLNAVTDWVHKHEQVFMTILDKSILDWTNKKMEVLDNRDECFQSYSKMAKKLDEFIYVLENEFKKDDKKFDLKNFYDSSRKDYIQIRDRLSKYKRALKCLHDHLFVLQDLIELKNESVVTKFNKDIIAKKPKILVFSKDKPVSQKVVTSMSILGKCAPSVLDAPPSIGIKTDKKRKPQQADGNQEPSNKRQGVTF